MKRNSTSLMGPLHPVLFMLTVYIISIVLAFFVCNTIYNSLHGSDNLADKNSHGVESLTALK